MDKTLLARLYEIKERYSKGENVVQYIKNLDQTEKSSLEAILISYDLQAGTYTKFADDNPDYKKQQGASLAKVMGQLGAFDSILEAGVGEATTLSHLLKHLVKQPANIFGLDVSWSRIKYAAAYSRRLGYPHISLAVGDLFHTPFLDNAIDIVYTYHSIEPNGGREKEALQELYRITKKYLVLCEPAYDFADEAGRQRMKSHGFICDLYPTALELGYKIIEHRLFDISYNKLNPTGLTIIEKKYSEESNLDIDYACPITHQPLKKYGSCYFSEQGLLSYPVIEGIPCLLPSQAIVTTHLSEFNK